MFFSEIIEAKVKLKIMKDLFEASEKIIAEKEAELREESIRLASIYSHVQKLYQKSLTILKL